MRLLFLVLLVSPVFSNSYSSKICSDYGHNWAAEIRCLRSMLNQCHDGVSPGRDSLPEPRIRTIRAGPFVPQAEARTIDTRLASRYAQHQSRIAEAQKANYTAMMKKVSEMVDKRVAEATAQMEKEIARRVNELRNWMDSELKKLEGRDLGSAVDSAALRQNELDIKKLTRRVDLLSAKVYRFGGSEYILLMNRESWYRGEEICLEWGGHLASVTSEEENKFLATLLDGETAWIGLNDVQLENVYVNSDRAPSKYRFWASGQPDNQNHNENCVEMSRNGQWSDLLCLLRRPFFCKR